MTMVLHGYYRSSTSYRLRIALALKRLAYDSVPVNLLEAEQRGNAYRGRNPFGTVPMLEAGGRERAQSLAILEWLEEAHPDHPLLPKDIEQRFTVRELAYAIATELHAPLNQPVLKYLRDELRQEREAVTRWYHHWLARTFEPVEARLDQYESGDFLFDRPGLFETILVPQLYNARRFGLDLTPYPRITRIDAACTRVDPFIAAHPDNQPDAPEKPQ